MEIFKKCRYFLLFIVSGGMLMFFSLLVHARNIDVMSEDTLTGNLTSMEDVKWYSFEMSEPGDVEVIIRGFKEEWDGWSSHWSVVLYAPDQQTMLAEGKACAYNDEYNQPLRLSLLGLESGIYYVQISSVSDSHFTTDSYQLELVRTNSSEQPFVSSNDSMYMIGTEPFLDRLISEDQIQWYAFEMAEPGDAVIFVGGLQEAWDGYAYHWRCTVYEDDLETAISYTDVRGYTENSGESIMSMPDLNAGTYYVQMTSTSSANPFLTSFTTDPYRIHLIRYYHSASSTYDGDGFQTFQKAGDILWAFDGTAFLKLNDGECFGALMESTDGAIVPILISTEAAAVEYVVSATGELITSGESWHHKDSGIDYYYSQCGNIEQYTDRPIKTSSLPILYINQKGALTAGEIIADKRLEAEYGKMKYLWMKLKEKAWLFEFLFIVLLMFGFFSLVGPAWGGDEGSFSGTGSYSDNQSFYDERMHDDIDAAIHATRISERYGSDWTGYDPESSGPDPDSYTSSWDNM